ncbi:hypothetical protein NDU88_001713 [Pleurodeles waltl]|uniref:Uncharacterized protein n=1 Tax=Pleurodeles waltl TaxID=8319 RepID=A0AAV7WMC5_PLEWA|nr:hypothetical protein NDU88_001713 [Pleurodeles waltl]
MADDKVRKALALLEQAGRMDIVRPEAGVAAAVMVRSPPHAARTVAQVRSGRRGKGGPGRKGAVWTLGGTVMVGPAWAGPKGNPRQPERSHSERCDRGRVRGHEPGATCTARPDEGRGGNPGHSGLKKRKTAGQPLRQGTGAGEDPRKGLGERPRGQGLWRSIT